MWQTGETSIINTRDNEPFWTNGNGLYDAHIVNRHGTGVDHTSRGAQWASIPHSNKWLSKFGERLLYDGNKFVANSYRPKISLRYLFNAFICGIGDNEENRNINRKKPIM